MQHNKHKDTDQDPVVPGQKRRWGAHKTKPGTEDVLITDGSTCWYDVQLWRGRYSHLSLVKWKEQRKDNNKYISNAKQKSTHTHTNTHTHTHTHRHVLFTLGLLHVNRYNADQ